MKTLMITSVALATLLAACGGSDAPAATDAAAVASVADDQECGLTEEQIGDPTIAVVGSYMIVDGDLACEATPEEAATYELFTGLIPEEYREVVVAFVGIDTDESDGTDGALQDIYDDNDDPTGERFIALDVTGASTELERTIVHEMGHSIFITAASDVPTGYAVDFNATFEPGVAYEDAPDEFVTEYAASADDGSEDMAESWAMYVFGGTPFAGDADDDGELDVVEPGTIAAEKVAFWDAYPELVQLRDDILANAGF
ncbi:MAG: hypothetical protein WBP59_11310 [Ilumatobacteraceae bacterium]